MSKWREVSLDAILSRTGWLIVVSSALTLSAWSLYWVGRRYGLPPILAGIVSASFDGAALVCADLALRYARTHGDSGLAPRIGVLILAAASAYLNEQHALILHDPFAARILYATPPVTGVTLFEMHSRYQRRAALRRAGRIAEALPVFGRWAWMLFPLRTLAVLRGVIANRLESIETSSGVSQTHTGVSRTAPDSKQTPRKQAVRAWARTNGMSVGDRGPIPDNVTSAYLSAVSGTTGNGHHAP